MRRSSPRAGALVSLLVMTACGDNVRAVDAGVDAIDPGLPFVELPLLDGYNHSSEVTVAWYESTGPRGTLLYAHAVTDDPGGAWSDVVLVDPDACPGERWYPDGVEAGEGARRLREYIGLAVANGRVHVAWTHAPDPPSRVRVASFDVE